MKIWANCIVHNEDIFLWFAVTSIVPYVDKILVWDTGSTDKTIEVIEELQKRYPKKIELKEMGVVNQEQFTKARQEMLESSTCDWILILDGDEIWWEESIKKITDLIKERGDHLDGIVVPFIVPVGDLYHFQSEDAGQYKLLGEKGHFSLRAINLKIPGLHLNLPYGQEGYFDNRDIPVQNRERVVLLDAPYLHATHLKRSTSPRKYNKIKFELGENKEKNFKYPEVLNTPNPITQADIWGKRDLNYIIKGLISYPKQYIWRKILNLK